MLGETTDLLSRYQVGHEQLPTLHYIPDYISAAEEERLLKEVHASKAKWVQLSGRRLQNHGGMVHAKGLIPAPLPTWLQQLLARLPPQLLSLFPPEQPPNHVLINSYQPGCGIMPHEDGPLYHPVVLILSLGSPAVLRFWRKQPTDAGGDAGGTAGLTPPVASLLAMPRSLLVFQDDAYTHCLHGIEEVTEERLDSSVVNTAAAAALTEGEMPGQEGGTPEQGNGQPHSCQQQQQQQTHASNSEPGCTAGASGNGSFEQPQQCCQGVSSGVPADASPPPAVARQGERISLTIRRVIKVHKALGVMRR